LVGYFLQITIKKYKMSKTSTTIKLAAILGVLGFGYWYFNTRENIIVTDIDYQKKTFLLTIKNGLKTVQYTASLYADPEQFVIGKSATINITPNQKTGTINIVVRPTLNGDKSDLISVDLNDQKQIEIK